MSDAVEVPGMPEGTTGMPADATREPLETVVAAVAGLRGELDAISAQIHGHPETAFDEHFAHDTLSAWLEQRGFAVDRGVADLPTAFVARLGAGTPRVAIIAEYDALPGLGHGCGHNLIAAGAVVAAAALAEVLAPDPDFGTLLVVGAPGEEGGGGKVLELERGVYDDLDAALMFHPADRTLPWHHTRSSAHLHVRYTGTAAHAAKSPEAGRSALAALIQLYVSLDSLRQFVPPTAQIHGVIRHGGDAPNVVPEHACADFLVRESTLAANDDLVSRFRSCAEAAATATGTTCEVVETAPRYSERKNNHALAERIASYLRAQKVDVEVPSRDNPAGSSDIGNVSLRLPVAHPYLEIADRGTPGHSRAMLLAAATPRAHDATEKMVVALAQTAFDLFSSPDFLGEVHAEFEVAAPDGA